MQLPKPERILVLSAIAALMAAGGFGVSGQSPQASPTAVAEKLPLPPPEQPLPFDHKLHVGLGVKCLDCHPVKAPGFMAGYPRTATCMVCHAAIKADSPHIQKVAEAEQSKTPIEWVKVYKVPDYVWFSHQTHAVDAKVACETCHGPVAERQVIFKEKPTSMVSCMDCHAQHEAPNDCDLCHNPA